MGKPKIGRPKIEIDAKEVEKLASFGCPNVEIATLLGCSENTIRRRFGEETAKGRASLKKSLRRKQVEVALSGNATMLIWTGKNLLDQSDKQEVDQSGKVEITVVYKDSHIASKSAPSAEDDQEQGA